MFPEVQEIMALLKVGLTRDEIYSFCLDIVKSRLLVKSIKENITLEDLKTLQQIEGVEESTSSHIIVDELYEHIYSFGP